MDVMRFPGPGIVIRVVLLAVGLCGTSFAWALDDGPSGSSRIENEYKLSLPVEKYDTVWNFITDTYIGENRLGKIDPDFTTSRSVEYFADQYFDDDDFTLLRKQDGIRLRSRFIPDDPMNEKNGRQLLQIKLSNIDEKSDLNRAEIKFDVSTRVKHNIKHLVPYLQPQDLHDIVGIVAGLGVDIRNLKKKVMLSQERRRVYISYRKAPFATITLDRIDSSFLMWSCQFTEVEVELNEILYTAMTPEKRDEMEKVSALIKNALQQEFSFIVRDQTPKYNKASACLGAKTPFYETLVNLF